MDGTTYKCSDGQFYGDVQLWERFERDEWSPFCWEAGGREWVETSDGEILALTPVSPDALPAGMTVTAVRGGIVVEERAAVPTEVT